MDVLKFGPEIGETDLKPVLVLHGFPSIRSKQNRDIAERIALQLKRPVRLLLYSGCGFSDGEFRFSTCLKEVENFFDKELKPHGPVDLVGHSWGGFQSIYLASRFTFNVRRIVLMSPLLQFFDASVSQEFFAEIARDNPNVAIGSAELIARDMQALGAKYPTSNLISKVTSATKVHILQATDDPTTKPEIAQEYLKYFIQPPRFELVETDHSFLVNRSALMDRIVDALVVD